MTSKQKLHAYIADIHADWKAEYSGKHPRMYRADEVDAEIERLKTDLRAAKGTIHALTIVNQRESSAVETTAHPTCHYAGPCDYQSVKAGAEGPHCQTCQCGAPSSAVEPTPRLDPKPCNHPRSELLAAKGGEGGAFEMRKCLECAKIFRVRLSVKASGDDQT